MEIDSLGHGAVTFNPAIEPTPHSERTEGNVRIVTNASPGRPAYFETSFSIHFTTAQADGVASQSSVLLNVALAAKDEPQSYQEIEKSAFERLPAMLREMADLLAAEVESPAD